MEGRGRVGGRVGGEEGRDGKEGERRDGEREGEGKGASDWHSNPHRYQSFLKAVSREMILAAQHLHLNFHLNFHLHPFVVRASDSDPYFFVSDRCIPVRLIPDKWKKRQG